MAYTKTTWLDRVVQFPMRFFKTGETSGGVTLSPDSGTITQAGTPINAANLNKLEQGVFDVHVKTDTLYNQNQSTHANAVGLTESMKWKNFGNGHVIFDASAGTAPNGTAVNNTNSQSPWVATHGSIMGWNGSNTFGVRVDSARNSDYINGVQFRMNNGLLEVLSGGSWIGAGMNTMVRGSTLRFENLASYTLSAAQATANQAILVGKIIPAGVGEILIEAEIDGGYKIDFYDSSDSYQGTNSYPTQLLAIVPKDTFQAWSGSVYTIEPVIGYGGPNGNIGVDWVLPVGGVVGGLTYLNGGVAVAEKTALAHRYRDGNLQSTVNTSGWTAISRVIRVYSKQPVYLFLKCGGVSVTAGQEPKIRNVRVRYDIG